MADLRVITLLPAQSVAGVQTSSAAIGAHGGAAAISKLPPGTILSGFIINRDASGNPILRTANGDITFSSNFFLNIGSEVTIRIESAPGGQLAHILSVDGQPPEVAANLSAFAQEPEIIVSQNLAPPETPQTIPAAASQPQAVAPVATAAPQASVTVKATLIAPPPVASPPLPAGTQLTLTVSSIATAPSQLPEDILALIAAPQEPSATPPAPAATSSYAIYARATGAQPAPAAPSIPVATPVPQTQTSIPPTPAAAAPTNPPPSAISTLIANVPAPPSQPAATALTTIVTSAPAIPAVTLATPAAAPSPVTTATPITPAAFTAPVVSIEAATPPAPAIPIAASPPQPGQNITGTVIANASTGETLVQTPVGIVQLAAGAQLPAGSQVTFNVVQVTPPPAPASTPTSTAPASLPALAQHWESLQKIFLLLASRGDASLASVQSLMPTLPAPAAISTQAPPPTFSAGLMLFIAALKGGDFTNWLGESNVQWLQNQGQGDLVKKADAEFSAMARQYAEPVPDRWQALFFPVAVAGEVQQARLFVKRDRKSQRGDVTKKTADTRFVVEVGLSQLGELQMDGFVRKQSQDVQFDLVIRSLAPLPQQMQQDILSIYDDAGKITGYKGALSFQTVRHFPVNPMEDIIAQSSGTVA